MNQNISNIHISSLKEGGMGIGAETGGSGVKESVSSKHQQYIDNARSLLKKHIPELYNFLQTNHIEKEYLNASESYLGYREMKIEDRIKKVLERGDPKYYFRQFVSIHEFPEFFTYNRKYERYIERLKKSSETLNKPEVKNQ